MPLGISDRDSSLYASAIDNSGYSLLHERIELVSTPVVIKYFSDVFEINGAVLKVTLIKP